MTNQIKNNRYFSFVLKSSKGVRTINRGHKKMKIEQDFYYGQLL